MKWLKRLGIAILVLVAILALVPFFVSLNDYIPAIEREVSARIQEPVSIDNVRASGLPVPHLIIDGITIGTAEDVKVGKVVVIPDLWSLMRRVWVIRSVELHDLVLTPRALSVFPAWTQSEAGPLGVRIERIQLEDALVRFENGRFGPFDAWVSVNARGEPEGASLVTRDGTLHARITPEGGRLALDIAARGWTPPLGPPVRFDEVIVQGVATAQGAELTEISGRLYGGTVHGQALLGWSDGLLLKGAVDVKHVELKQLGTLISPQARVSGRLNAKATFSAVAPAAAALDERLRVDAPFSIQDGVLYGFDLASVLDPVAPHTPGPGADTRFDLISGHAVREQGAYRLRRLELATGSLAARGAVDISQEKVLSGELQTTVKADDKVSRLSLTVAGSLASPVIYPMVEAVGRSGGVQGVPRDAAQAGEARRSGTR
jgi:uncharacterized protein involved in outer membrane biogenesis